METVYGGGYTKNEIEDFAGCIPWFLDKCMVDKEIKLNIKFFDEIYTSVLQFEQGIKSNCKDYQWLTYATLILPARHR
jgi:hypothetical protein